MDDGRLDAGEDAVDRRADTPLWLQLRLLIKRQIEDGALSPGEQLPSEAELCERFSVSRTVVREALGQLVVDGRIYKIKGKGAFVSKRKGDEEFVGTTMGFWEEMSGKGSQVQTKVLAQDLAEASERERAALRLDEHAQVVRLRRPPAAQGDAPEVLRAADGVVDQQLRQARVDDPGVDRVDADAVLAEAEAGARTNPTSPALEVEYGAVCASG